jgi:hypothetical protein
MAVSLAVNQFALSCACNWERLWAEKFKENRKKAHLALFLNDFL